MQSLTFLIKLLQLLAHMNGKRRKVDGDGSLGVEGSLLHEP